MGEKGNGFDPNEHLTNIKGGQYLEVKWRLVWFREQHPAGDGWGIVTQAEEVTDSSARYRAAIIDPGGRTVATGTKTETKAGFGDFVEKAETGAIGRALALLGYGTQWCVELEEGERIVDSPVGQQAPEDSEFGPCPKCGKPLQLRKRKSDGGEFVGCTGYPKCKVTYDVEEAPRPDEWEAPPEEDPERLMPEEEDPYEGTQDDLMGDVQPTNERELNLCLKEAGIPQPYKPLKIMAARTLWPAGAPEHPTEADVTALWQKIRAWQQAGSIDDALAEYEVSQKEEAPA